MSWDLPNEQEMAQYEASIPERIPDLPAGPFIGLIEEVETEMDDQGNENKGYFNLAIRIKDCGNPDYIGKLMSYRHYMTNARGKLIPKSYRWVTALLPGILTGEKFHPSDLTFIEFGCIVEYNGKYWNLVGPKFIEKTSGFAL